MNIGKARHQLLGILIGIEGFVPVFLLLVNIAEKKVQGGVAGISSDQLLQRGLGFLILFLVNLFPHMGQRRGTIRGAHLTRVRVG